MKKLNLHAHSNFSDGRDTILNMAKCYQRNGYVCAVLTDHDYYFINLKTGEILWEKLDNYFLEGERVQEELSYPVILGIEVSLINQEEGVLFGKKAIYEWFKERRDLRIRNNWSDAKFKKENHAMILVHPMFSPEYNYPQNFLDLFYAVEIYTSGHYLLKGQSKNKKYFSVLNRMKNCNRIRNLDAHAINRWFEGPDNIQSRPYCVNYIEDKVIIKSEVDLIHFLRNSKQTDWKYKKGDLKWMLKECILWMGKLIRLKMN